MIGGHDHDLSDGCGPSCPSLPDKPPYEPSATASRSLLDIAAQGWHRADQAANPLHNRVGDVERCPDCASLNPHLSPFELSNSLSGDSKQDSNSDRQPASPAHTEACHCGRPVHVYDDGFTRGMCEACSAVRCDITPAHTCPGSVDSQSPLTAQEVDR